MKLYSAFSVQSGVKGNCYLVKLHVYNEKNKKKDVQIVYELSGETGLRCTIEILKNPGISTLGKPEYTAIASLFIGSKADVKKVLACSTNEDSLQKFQSMNNQSIHKSYLAAELEDIFGSYTTVNHAVMHNIPHLFLSFM